MPANKKKDQCPSVQCICSLKSLTDSSERWHSDTHCHSQSWFTLAVGKQTESFVFVSQLLDDTDLSRSPLADPDQDPGVWRGSSPRTATRWQATAMLAPRRKLDIWGPVLIVITVYLPTFTPKLLLLFFFWFSLLSFFIVQRTKCFFIQQIRQVFKDSGNIFRTAMLLNDPLGFSKITGYLFFKEMDA